MAKEIRNDTNLEVICNYLVSDPGEVELTEKQKELLERWAFADEQIRKHEMNREIISKLIIFKFKVSRVTSYQDIVNAENVFASSTPLNKKYRIQLRIEFLEMKISELYGMVKMEPVDEAGEKIDEEEEGFEKRVLRIKGNQEYLHEAKELEKILQKYYHDYPNVVPPRSPKTIIYNMIYANLPAPAFSVEEALRRDGRIIDIKPNENGGKPG